MKDVVISFTKEERDILEHVCDMELTRLEKLRSDAENINVFDEIYGNHINEIKKVKMRLNMSKEAILM